MNDAETFDNNVADAFDDKVKLVGTLPESPEEIEEFVAMVLWDLGPSSPAAPNSLGEITDAVALASLGSHPSIVAGLHARGQKGLGKYGTALHRGWKRAPAAALQEALDLWMYLRADDGATLDELEAAKTVLHLVASRAFESRKDFDLGSPKAVEVELRFIP